MRISLSCLLLALLLVPTVARADDHRADWYGGGSGGNGASKLFGFHQAFAVPFKPEKYNNLSLVISDVSVQFGSHDTASVTQVVYVGGLRYTLGRDYRIPVKVSVHGLLGTVYTNADGPSDNDFGAVFGVGIDWIKDRTDPRLMKGLGVRVQIDGVYRSGDRDSFFRVSGGLLYRFGQQKH